MLTRSRNRELSDAGLARATSDYAIFDAGEPGARPLIGRLAARGLSDELNARHYAIVDGLDGRAHYVELGEARDSVPVGSIVQIRGTEAAPREVDRTVARIARQNGGRYSEDLHHQADPKASREFMRAHTRRLEAMRRLAGIVEREPDGVWRISPEEYRAKWGLPADYPMVAPKYAAQRSAFAKKIGLGHRLAEPRRRKRG